MSLNYRFGAIFGILCAEGPLDFSPKSQWSPLPLLPRPPTLGWQKPAGCLAKERHVLFQYLFIHDICLYILALEKVRRSFWE
jgi:hypothetical protein